MKRATCDICGAVVGSEYDLASLLDGYKSADIKDICRDCEKEVNSRFHKINAVIHNIRRSWVMRMIDEMKRQRGTYEFSINVVTKDDGSLPDLAWYKPGRVRAKSQTPQSAGAKNA